jgi:hypothetical protein
MAFIKERYPETYAWVEEHQHEEGKRPDYKEVCSELQKLLKGYKDAS